MDELTTKLIELKKARDKYEAERKTRQELIELFDERLHANTDYIRSTQEMELAKAIVDQIESEVKSQSLEIFAADNTNKKLAGGNVTIKEFTKTSITDREAAREWATREAPQFIVLDDKGIEKHAKAVADTVPLPFVEITKEPQAQIASKLELPE